MSHLALAASRSVCMTTAHVRSVPKNEEDSVNFAIGRTCNASSASMAKDHGTRGKGSKRDSSARSLHMISTPSRTESTGSRSVTEMRSVLPRAPSPSAVAATLGLAATTAA